MHREYLLIFSSYNIHTIQFNLISDTLNLNYMYFIYLLFSILSQSNIFYPSLFLFLGSSLLMVVFFFLLLYLLSLKSLPDLSSLPLIVYVYIELIGLIL